MRLLAVPAALALLATLAAVPAGAQAPSVHGPIVVGGAGFTGLDGVIITGANVTMAEYEEPQRVGPTDAMQADPQVVWPGVPLALPTVCMYDGGINFGACYQVWVPGQDDREAPAPDRLSEEAESAPEKAAAESEQAAEAILAEEERSSPLQAAPGEAQAAEPAPAPRATEIGPPAPALTGSSLQQAPSQTQRLAWALATAVALPGALLAKLAGSFLLARRAREARPSLRDDVLAAIAAHPGIRHRELVRRIGRGNGTVEHHVRTLIAEGRVERLRQGGSTAYAPAGGVPQEEVALRLALEGRTSRRLAQDVAAHPGSRLTDVARRVGVSLATAHYQAGKLASAGVLRRASLPGGGRRLEVAPAALACLASLPSEVPAPAAGPLAAALLPRPARSSA